MFITWHQNESKIAFWRENVNILTSFKQRYNERHYVTFRNLKIY